jgi:hypothetical protein
MFLAAGGFDEDFFCYFEDTDLAWRARVAGWRCRYNPKAVVYHKHRGSEVQLTRDSAVPRHVLAWCERNRVWMVLKNAGLSTLLLSLPLLAAREAYVVVEALRQRDLYKLRARRDALRLLEPMLQKRRAVQAKRRAPEREVRAWMGALPGLRRGAAGQAAAQPAEAEPARP